MLAALNPLAPDFIVLRWLLADMPHSYSLDIEDSETLRYSKTHKNGERTEVQADIVSSTVSSGPEKWRAYVNDPNGSVDLGEFNSKRQAKNKMQSWMNKHEKGVPGSDNGISGFGNEIAGGSGGIPGMDGDSLF